MLAAAGNNIINWLTISRAWQRKTPREVYIKMIKINKQEETKASNFLINMLMCKVDLSGVVTRSRSHFQLR
jgi:hypothetical protein